MKILYVEDNPRDADLSMRQLFKTAPHFQIETVTTLREAWARLERLDAEPLDLVLTGVRLPRADGPRRFDYRIRRRRNGGRGAQSGRRRLHRQAKGLFESPPANAGECAPT